MPLSSQIFAPTNDAFAVLDVDTLDFLQDPANKDALVDVLNYHILQGQVMSSDLVDGNVTSLNGDDVSVILDPFMVNGASVLFADVGAANVSWRTTLC